MKSYALLRKHKYPQFNISESVPSQFLSIEQNVKNDMHYVAGLLDCCFPI